jgi:hypothetical protein
LQQPRHVEERGGEGAPRAERVDEFRRQQVGPRELAEQRRRERQRPHVLREQREDLRRGRAPQAVALEDAPHGGLIDGGALARLDGRDLDVGQPVAARLEPRALEGPRRAALLVREVDLGLGGKRAAPRALREDLADAGEFLADEREGVSGRAQVRDRAVEILVQRPQHRVRERQDGSRERVADHLRDRRARDDEFAGAQRDAAQPTRDRGVNRPARVRSPFEHAGDVAEPHEVAGAELADLDAEIGERLGRQLGRMGVARVRVGPLPLGLRALLVGVAPARRLPGGEPAAVEPDPEHQAHGDHATEQPRHPARTHARFPNLCLRSDDVAHDALRRTPRTWMQRRAARLRDVEGQRSRTTVATPSGGPPGSAQTGARTAATTRHGVGDGHSANTAAGAATAGDDAAAGPISAGALSTQHGASR